MNTTSKLMKIEKIIRGLKGEKKAGNKSHNRKTAFLSISLLYIISCQGYVVNMQSYAMVCKLLFC